MKGKGQGWHEPADHTGKAPEHVAVAIRESMKDTLRRPQFKKGKKPQKALVKSWQMTRKELWANNGLVGTYIEGTDASFLIGKHYLLYNRFQKELLHELSIIPIQEIRKTSEKLSEKTPQYSELTTQAPPVDVTLEEDKSYRLFNGHRRLKSAIKRGEHTIFAEIHHRKTHKEIVEQAIRDGEFVPIEVLNDYGFIRPKEYQCPNCGAMKSIFPSWAGRKRFYQCEVCKKEYSSKALDRAWGRDSNKHPNPLTIMGDA